MIPLTLLNRRIIQILCLHQIPMLLLILCDLRQISIRVSHALVIVDLIRHLLNIFAHTVLDEVEEFIAKGFYFWDDFLSVDLVVVDKGHFDIEVVSSFLFFKQFNFIKLYQLMSPVLNRLLISNSK